MTNETPKKDVEESLSPQDAKADGGAAAAPFVPTDPSTGLTDDQVEKQREVYGLNEIPAPDTPLYVIFLRQFVGFLPVLIEIAMIVALAVEDWADFGIIAGTCG